MTAGQMVKTYFFRFQMSGIAEALVYPASQEDSQRLQHVLEQTEKKHQAWPFFFFTTTDEQKVIVSLSDIQMVTFGWDMEMILDDEETDEETEPKIEIYFRGTPGPYQEFLGDPGTLETIFLANAFDFEDEPFTYFLDDDGEETFFRPDQVVLLSYSWQELKRNHSLVYRVRGPAPDGASSGMWRIQAWQSDQGEDWYSDLEFVVDGQATAVIIESYGPGSAKTEAVEMARRGLETSWLNPRDPPLF